MLFLCIVLVIVLILVFVRYEPKLDLVVSKNTHILLLWYNKIEEGYVQRTYIKVMEL